MRPRIFIGIGGTGVSIANQLRQRIIDHYGVDSDEASHLFHVFGFDGERWHNQMYDQKHYGWTGSFNPARYLGELKSADVDTDWWPIPLHKSTRVIGVDGLGMVRANGFLALLYHLHRTMGSGSDTKIHEMAWDAHAMANNVLNNKGIGADPPTIILAGSLAGATGSGIGIPLAVLLKGYLEQNGVPDSSVLGVFLLPDTQVGKSRTMTKFFNANGYAALWEASFWASEESLDYEFSYPYSASRTLEFEAHGVGGLKDELPPKPFDMMYLIGRQSKSGQFLDHFSEYEQMAVDVIFELEFSATHDIMANLQALGQDAGGAFLSSGGKAILRYPVEKHERRVMAGVMETLLHEAGLGQAEIQELGESLGNDLWEGIKHDLLNQQYQEPVMVRGRTSDFTAPSTKVAQLEAVIENADAEDYAKAIEAVRSQWQSYKRDISEQIAAVADEEFGEDWSQVREDLLALVSTGAPKPWGAVHYAVRILGTKIERQLQVLQEERTSLSRQTRQLERSLETSLREMAQAYETQWRMPLRSRAKEAAAQAVEKLILAHWRSQTTQADIEHLGRINAKLQGTFALATQTLHNLLGQWQPTAEDESDIYEKTEVVVEVLGKREVADSALETLLDSAADPEIQELMDGVRYAFHVTVARFIRDDLLPHVQKGYPVTAEGIANWQEKLAAALSDAVGGGFRPLVDRTVWQALEEEAAATGRDPVKYARVKVRETAGRASPWLKVQETVDPGPAWGNHPYVLYDPTGWTDFVSRHELPEDELSGWAGIKTGEDTQQHEVVPGANEDQAVSRYEVSFFSIFTGFEAEDIINWRQWEADAADVRAKGRRIFVDSRVTPRRIEGDSSKIDHVRFLLAEHFGVIQNKGSIYTHHGATLETGLKGRQNTIRWFAGSDANRKSEVLEDLVEEWNQVPPERRREVFEDLRDALLAERNSRTASSGVGAAYGRDVNIMEWALDNELFDSDGLIF